MILVGGEALIDVVQRPARTAVATPGGGPFNVARTIARLGAPVRFCGTISHDLYGDQLIECLRADGVDLAATLRSTLPTPVANATVDERGNATYTFAFDDTAAAQYPADARPPLTGIDAVHIGTLGLVFEPMASTYRTMVSQAPDDTLVVVDPNCRPMVISDRQQYLDGLAPVLARADVVKVSVDDLDYLSPRVDPIDAARSLIELGARAVLLTAGAEGTIVLTASGDVTVPTTPVHVVDTVGAGDSLGGAFTAWWVLNALGRGHLDDIELLADAVRAATEVASITCQRVGADPPRRDELRLDWSTPASRRD
jgi:fructokinase